jgi:ATP-dependent DNA helicase RecQ
MNAIVFIDTETNPERKKIIDIGAVKHNGATFHKNSVVEFIEFIKGEEFICGHNVLNHDLKYIYHAVERAGIKPENIIDTLFLSPLFFPTKPYHALVKDDKLQSDEANNPLNDAIKAKDLFWSEVTAFYYTEETLKQIFYLLLNTQKEFAAFFRYVNYQSEETDTSTLISQKFKDEICNQADLAAIISEYPVELAYCLSLLNSIMVHQKTYSITPPWVLKNYPKVEQILFRLRKKPCLGGCPYCNKVFDAQKGLKKFFGFDSFRSYGGEPLQEKAVEAAIHNKSILAVFPTGGGKSITFQLPALMGGEQVRGLTVVISPLQSLMKDQVDNLEKIGITNAVTINGLLDPIERAKSYERVENGSASILYISPEALRSKTIEDLLLGRKLLRFVIDEAHCFSAWGQDFRVDYLYIGDFIKQIQEKKNLEEPIPVSCFTATAKQKVIQDIQDYFKEKLNLDLELFTTKASRTNLRYKVVAKQDDEKYQYLRNLLEEKKCPTIVYVARTKNSEILAQKLTKDGLNAMPYHGKMKPEDKIVNQNAFIAGQTSIMVATSAFGMGVDKKDVGLVIHYEISDSLENYVQEAGRAGRDENIDADCLVMFNDEDINKHFILLNQTKLSLKEINQVWKAVKGIEKFRTKFSCSALEIARKAGWDDSVAEIETRVTSAIAALEDAGYVKRGQNSPRVFANSILARNVQEAIEKINASQKFEEKQKENAIRIIKKLFSSKSRKQSNDEIPESRIDYISDHLGIVKEDVIRIVELLREEGILADAKDLTAFVKRGENKNRSLNILETHSKIENFLVNLFDEEEKTFSLKELNEQADINGCKNVDLRKIKTIINFWAIKNWIRRENHKDLKNHIAVRYLYPKEKLKDKLQKVHQLARFIVEFLYEKSNLNTTKEEVEKEEVLVEFSIQELKQEFSKKQTFFSTQVSLEDVENALFYLSRIEAIKIEGGFLVVYNRLTIERTELNNKKQYTKEDYKKLQQFYENKIQQIHIVAEYAKKMLTDYKEAMQFVEDYFQLNYSSFLYKYFKGSRQDEIKRNISPAKFKQLFGELSPTQLKIVKDNESKYIVVAAGPGSGKTKLLVHKLASLLLMEDVKHEQLLMLTFSRVSATEFKERLLKLVGNAVHFVQIQTFHSYCFDVLGKVGNVENSNKVLNETIQKIKDKEVEISYITKTVLVVDEAQDMGEDEYNLVRLLMEENEEMRVIAVGDDDQNIYQFRGSSSKYLEQFITEHNAVKYELVENYRSKKNLVEFTNQFVQQIKNRLKETPVIAKQSDNGKIKIVRYQSNHLITPLVKDICSTDLTGTTCVLTVTNDQALQITGLLLKNKIPAKLIQSNDGFNLYNLNEIRFFLDQLKLSDNVKTIDTDIWENAKIQLWQKFSRSTQIELCNNIIKDFETINPKLKYKTDLEMFIRESKMEDFFHENGEIIFVSTIHKAKGKEFDNVFLLLENFNPDSEENKRKLYVAMTRAKQNLIIHLKSNISLNFDVENTEWIQDKEIYSPPDKLVMQLSMKDVWLDYFIQKQHLISSLVSGDTLTIRENECFNTNGQSILKFSKTFQNEIQVQKQKGYILNDAKVNFIVYWLKENTDKEVKIILPELWFQKTNIQ